MQFINGYPYVTLAIATGYLLHYTPHGQALAMQRMIEHTPLIVKAVVFSLFIYLVLQVSSSEVVPFIYMQF